MKNIYERITAWLAGPFSTKISRFTQNAYVMAIQNRHNIGILCKS